MPCCCPRPSEKYAGQKQKTCLGRKLSFLVGNNLGWSKQWLHGCYRRKICGFVMEVSLSVGGNGAEARVV